MISVSEALEALFALVFPLESETVPLRQAAGRVLARPATATRAQPPFSASSMDGYALHREDARTGQSLEVIGEAAAGGAFAGQVARGQAVRIFTGAPLPHGPDHVEIQENVSRDGDQITLQDADIPGSNVRPAGGDFRPGDTLDAPRRLSAADISLLASMNVAEVSVTRRPEIALLSTGDELVMPGEDPRDDQIIASNALGLEALLREAGALPRILPIARDTPEALASAFRFAHGSQGRADLIVTIGGASVGDHDLVRQVAEASGMAQSFYKVAMRPGKPLMAGRLRDVPVIGLPGNPVSTLVCGQVFLLPMISAMLGFPARAAPRRNAPLAQEIPANGPREHYMRANLRDGRIEVFDRQDSSLLSVLSRANILAIRPPRDPARGPGELMDYLPLDTKSEHL